MYYLYNIIRIDIFFFIILFSVIIANIYFFAEVIRKDFRDSTDKKKYHKVKEEYKNVYDRHYYDVDYVHKFCILKSIKNESNILLKISLIPILIIVSLYNGLEQILSYLDKHLSIFSD